LYVNERDFTHRASFYGLPCYFNLDSGMLVGRSRIWDRLIPVATWLHNYFIAPFNENGFPIRLTEEIRQVSSTVMPVTTTLAACEISHCYQSLSAETDSLLEHPDELAGRN